jgi:hypothetical protein
MKTKIPKIRQTFPRKCAGAHSALVPLLTPKAFNDVAHHTFLFPSLLERDSFQIFISAFPQPFLREEMKTAPAFQFAGAAFQFSFRK